MKSRLFLFILIYSGITLAQDLEPYTLGIGPSIDQGETLALYSVTWNFHSVAAPSSELKYYLSTTNDLNGTLKLLGTTILDPIPGVNYDEAGPTTWVVPVNFTPGNYYVIAVADPDNLISETNETNNLLAQPFEIKAINNRTELSYVANIPASNIQLVEREFSLSCARDIYTLQNWSNTDVGKQILTTGCRSAIMTSASTDFFLPPGVKMGDVTSITLEFDARSILGVTNWIHLEAMAAPCTGTARDIWDCMIYGTDAGRLTLSTPAGSTDFTHYTYSFGQGLFPANNTSFSFGFFYDRGNRISRLKNIKCKVEYTVDDLGCSQVQWWKDNVNAWNTNTAKEHILVDEFGNAIFRNTNNKISLAVEDAFGYHNIWELGHNLNYAVASNIAKKPGGDQYYYQGTDNKLYGLYLSGSTWLETNFGGITGNTCAGSVVTNSQGQIFYKTTSGGINCVYWTGTGWAWSGLNNAVTAGCAGDLTVNSNDQIFYRTTGGAINCLYWTGSGWAWSGLDNAVTFGCAGNLAVNSNDQVFYRTTGGAINCLYWTGSGWGWAGLSNAVTSGCAGDISVGADDKVYYVKTNGDINYVYYTGSGWANAVLTASAGIKSVTTEGGLASGANNFNSGYFIEAGNNLRRFYYGSAIGCDPSRSAVSGPGDPLAGSEDVEYFGSDLPSTPAVPSDLSAYDERQADVTAKPILANRGDGRYRIMLNGYVPESSYIMDMHGKAIVGKHQQVGQESIEVDLSSLASGVYMMHLIGSNGRQPQAIKFVR